MPKCPTCSRFYPDLATLHAHYTVYFLHTPDDFDPSIPPTVFCQHCRETFESIEVIRRHLDDVGWKLEKGKWHPDKALLEVRKEELARKVIEKKEREQLEAFKTQAVAAKMANRLQKPLRGPVVKKREEKMCAGQDRRAAVMLRRKAQEEAKHTVEEVSESVIGNLVENAVRNVVQQAITEGREDEQKVLKHGGNTYSVVNYTPDEHARLAALIPSPEELVKANYIISTEFPAGTEEIWKCRNCKGRWDSASLQFAPTECIFHRGHMRREYTNDASVPVEYTCCHLPPFSLGCFRLPTHNVFPESLPLHTPPANASQPKLAAIALDCEMGTDIHGQLELIQLSAIDYFTGRTIINALVRPSTNLRNYNTTFSGISAERMFTEVAAGRAIDGWRNARRELWRFMNAGTILVGHGMQNDLKVLGLIHTRLVDSHLAIPRVPERRHGLKELSSDILGLKVQEGDATQGHDPFEDALAARELIIWATRHTVLKKKTESVRLRRSASVEDLPAAGTESGIIYCVPRVAIALGPGHPSSSSTSSTSSEKAEPKLEKVPAQPALDPAEQARQAARAMRNNSHATGRYARQRFQPVLLDLSHGAVEYHRFSPRESSPEKQVQDMIQRAQRYGIRMSSPETESDAEKGKGKEGKSESETSAPEWEFLGTGEKEVTVEMEDAESEGLLVDIGEEVVVMETVVDVVEGEKRNVMERVEKEKEEKRTAMSGIVFGDLPLELDEE